MKKVIVGILVSLSLGVFGQHDTSEYDCYMCNEKQHTQYLKDMYEWMIDQEMFTPEAHNEKTIEVLKDNCSLLDGCSGVKDGNGRVFYHIKKED